MLDIDKGREVSDLIEELSGVYQLTGAVGDVPRRGLSCAVVLQVLVLNVVPSSYHKHKGLQGVGATHTSGGGGGGPIPQ